MEELQIFCDGGARGNPGPAASAFVVFDKEGNLVFKQGSYLGIATNNQAEYSAVLNALTWLDENNLSAKVMFYLDSQLVVNQINGTFKVKEKNLQEKKLMIDKLIGKRINNSVVFTYIPRVQNSAADKLVNETLDSV